MAVRIGFRHFAPFALALCSGLVATSSEAIVASIDELTVVRNGAVFFADSFDDGLVPPAGPGGQTSYNVTGSISSTAESGGRLLLDSVEGILTANAIEQPRQFLGVTLRSDASTNLGLGLKSDDTLMLTGTFGLTVPSGPLFSGYGVRFIDSNPTVHQVLQLFVRFNPTTNQSEITYLMQDFDANTITTLGSVPLAPPPGTDQIALSLTRSTVANDDFVGSFTYLSGGSSLGSGTFPSAGQMFQGEDFVRAQFFVAEGVPAIPEVETYALMMVGLGALGLVTRRRRATPVGGLSPGNTHAER